MVRVAQGERIKGKQELRRTYVSQVKLGQSDLGQLVRTVGF